MHKKDKLPNGREFHHLHLGECVFLYEEIFRDQVYLRNGIVLGELTEGHIVDAGANIGMSVYFFSSTAPKAKIIAIEPNPEAFAALTANNSLHDFKARLFQCAVSKESGAATFTSYPQKSALSGLYADPQKDSVATRVYLRNEGARDKDADFLVKHAFQGKQYECRLRRMSEILDEENVQKVSLMKIDVERAEVDVMDGIEERHWKMIEQLVMEVHSDELLHEVKTRLVARGYSVIVNQNPLLKGTGLYDLYARAGSAA